LTSLGPGRVASSAGRAQGQAQPDGQLTVAFDASIAPSFLDPAPGIGTPFVFLYALHDALVKPLPGHDMAPCLAESWRESPDGLVYEFKLRENLKFHNGDPFTAEDVMYERVMYGPIFEPATLHGVGPRVEEPAIGLNPQLYFTAPYEDIRLRKP
jgi:peptide/nickel transport system substrate-binding protein